jgi:hypothetical protein
LLTKTDVLAYWYKQKKYAIPLTNGSSNSMDHKRSFLIVSGNNWLLSISTHPHAATSITGFNSQAGIGFYSQRMGGVYPEFTFDPDKAWLLRMSTNKSEWTVSYDFESIEELENSILTFNRVSALDRVFQRVDENRTLFLNDFDACQGRIYQAKVEQAKEVVRQGLAQDDLMEYPFISGYARVEGIDIQEAAKRILIKNTMQEAGLAESENLRLRSKKAIMAATSMKELREAYDRFEVEIAKYGDL